MHRIKKLTAVILSTLTVSGVCVVGGMSAGASGTGAGLAEYALNAYDEDWSYVWGGTSPGAVDCSGLIWSYCGGNRMSMLSDAQSNGRDWGYVSNGIPRVHGLGLSRPGHVGVYIEDNMEVDARGDEWGVCYQEIGGWNTWECWFKLTAVSYPENGWEEFNGNYYYYEDGEYIVNTSREIDGTTYYFDSKGHSSETPSDGENYSSGSSSKSSDNESKKSATPSIYSLGSMGDEVEKIQERLTELGFYTGSIDGDFGPMTERAYRAFQEAAGVVVDGISGSDREVLYSDDAPKANAKADTSDDRDDEDADTEEVKDEDTKAEDNDAEDTKAEDNDAEDAADEDTGTENVKADKNVDDELVGAAADEKSGDEKTGEPAVEDIEFEKKTSVVYGDFTDDVLDIQTKLHELGYFGIDPTGYFGDYTVDAIKAFQEANKLTVTGELDAETLAVLNGGDAVANTVKEEEMVGPSPITSELTAGSAQSSVTAAAPTAPVQSTTSSAVNNSNSAVQKTNKAAEKALQDSANMVPDAQTAKVGRTANIWLWAVLTIIVISVVSLIFLSRTTRKPRKAKKGKAERNTLNERW